MGKADPVGTQKALGHKDFSTTARYIASEPSKQKLKWLFKKTHEIKNEEDLDNMEDEKLNQQIKDINSDGSEEMGSDSDNDFDITEY